MTQRKKRQKQIKLKDLTKQYNEVSTLSAHVLDEEEGIVILYYKKFDNKRIEALMKETYNSLQYDEKHKLNFFIDDSVFLQYIFFLILKHMTSLNDEIPDTLDAQISIFHQILSIGLIEEMLNNVFDPDEVSKVIERIGAFASLATQMAELEDSTRQEAADTVLQPFLKEKVSPSDAEI